MGVDAKVSAHLRIAGPKQTFVYEKLKVEKSPIATIILARGDGKDGHLVLFRRPFVHALLKRLHAQYRGQLDAADAGSLDRKSVVLGQMVSVRVLFVGCVTF